MKKFMKNLFSVVFTVLVIAMFSGCAATTPYSGSSFQESPESHRGY